MRKYTFAPVLGPADPHPIGSVERANCLGNEFDYHAERAVERGVDDIHAVLRRVIEEQPWLVPDNPIGQTMDEYVFGCSGFHYRQLWTLIDTFKPHHGLPRAEERSEFVTVRRDDLREALYGGNSETAFGEAFHRLAETAPGGEPKHSQRPRAIRLPDRV
jgi:hypothetical protein